LKSIGPERILSHLIKGNVNTLSELVSTGKSGSFFYYTADGKYTIKTIPPKEFKIFRLCLKNYYEHLVQYPNSFINKFIDLFIFISIFSFNKNKIKPLKKFKNFNLIFF